MQEAVLVVVIQLQLLQVFMVVVQALQLLQMLLMQLPIWVVVAAVVEVVILQEAITLQVMVVQA
jgi:hypothetical protein